MAGTRARRWCFTLNNPTDDEQVTVKTAFSSANTKFIIVGFEEAPTTGTPHLQGFVHFKTVQRITALKKLLPRAHFEMARGTDKENHNYCTKMGQTMIQHGAPQDHKEQSVPDTYKNALKLAKRFAAGEDPCEIWNAEPEMWRAYCCYKSVVHSGEQYIREHINKKISEEEVGDPRLLPWQKLLLEELNRKPDSRKIIWYVDPAGCSGKTTISRYLSLDSQNVICFENGKSADAKHAFNGQKIVIIDLARSSEQHINYEIMETLKNGSFFSPKYNSRYKHAGIPHLVVFANFYPDKDKMSADRWDIRILHNVNVEKDLLDIHASEVYEPRQLPILK